jgi:hypothetical protein
MGKVIIGQGLGAANTGGSLSVRLPNGQVVQAIAGAPISTPNVVAVEDEAGQFHAFPEAVNSAPLTTRQISRSRRRPIPALIEDDEYFFKVLQPSSLEGFGADIGLGLTDYNAAVLANRGNGYAALLANYELSSIIFVSDSGSATVTVNSFSGSKGDSFFTDNTYTSSEYVSFIKPGAGNTTTTISSKFPVHPGGYSDIAFFDLQSPATTTTQIEVNKFDGADYEKRNLVYSNTSSNITAPGGAGFNLPQKTLDAVLREKSRRTLTTYFVSYPISGYSVDTKNEDDFWETSIDIDDRKEYSFVDEYSYTIDTVQSFDCKKERVPVNYVEYYASSDHPVLIEYSDEQIRNSIASQYYYVAKRIDYTHTWTWTNQTDATTSDTLQSSRPQYAVYFKDVVMEWGYSGVIDAPFFDPVVVERFTGQVGGNAYLTAYCWVIALTPLGAGGVLGTDWRFLGDSIATVSKDLYYTFNDTIIFYEYPRASTPSKATTSSTSYVAGFGFQFNPMFTGLKGAESSTTESRVFTQKNCGTRFLIQRNNICLYFYERMDSSNIVDYSEIYTQTIDSSAPFPYLVPSTSSTTLAETILDNTFADLIIKTDTSYYTIKDLIGDTLDFGDRFYIYANSTPSISASFSLSIALYSIGAKNSNYGNYTKVPKKTINNNGVFTIEYYSLTPFTFVGKDVYIFQRIGGGLCSVYEGTISAEVFSTNPDGNYEYRSHTQITLSGVGLIGQSYLGFYNENYTIVISKTDFTAFITNFILPYPEQVNLYQKDGFIELAVSQAPDTIDEQEEWYADIYRFTSTLNWERRPNAVSPLSELSAVSDFISYHPDPSG